MSSNLIVLFGLLALVSGASAGAATVGDLSDVHADTILYKSQAARVDARNTLLSKQGLEDAAPPVVSGVYGANGRVYAEFLFSNGQTSSQAVGGSLPGGYVVKSISLNKVELKKGKRIILLGFSGSAPLVEKSGMQNPGNMPGYGQSMPMLAR